MLDMATRSKPQGSSELCTTGEDVNTNLLSLKWNNHISNFRTIIASLQENSILSDATLACEGQLFPVHKLILSTCSEFFSRMFSSTPCKHPVVVLQELKVQHLHYLLSYMYAGEVNVPQSHLPLLIKAAESLQIKGLAAPDEEPQNILNGDLLPGFKKAAAGVEQKGFTSGSHKAVKRRRHLSHEDNRNKSIDRENYKDATIMKQSTGQSLKEAHSVVNAGKRFNSCQGSSVNDIDESFSDDQESSQTGVKEETSANYKISKGNGEYFHSEDIQVKEENDSSNNNSEVNLDGSAGGGCGDDVWDDGHQSEEAVEWATAVDGIGPVSGMPWTAFPSASRCNQEPMSEVSFYNSLPVQDTLPLAHRQRPQQQAVAVDGIPASSAVPACDSLTIDNRATNCFNNDTSGAVLTDPQLMSVVGGIGEYGDLGIESCGAGGGLRGRPRTHSSSSSYVINGRKSIHSNNTSSGVSSVHNNNNNNNTTTTPSSSFPGSNSLHDCPLCRKQFQSRADVVRHLRTHTGERPYECPHCPYSAALKGNLKSHVLSRHAALVETGATC